MHVIVENMNYCIRSFRLHWHRFPNNRTFPNNNGSNAEYTGDTLITVLGVMNVMCSPPLLGKKKKYGRAFPTIFFFYYNLGRLYFLF